MRDTDGWELDHTTSVAMRVRAVGQFERRAGVEDVAEALASAFHR